MDTNIALISGGICAPQGFNASGLHCGIAKKEDKKDLALIYSPVKCQAGAVYTRNKVQAYPLQVTKKHLENGVAQAVICNSGNANCCNAEGLKMAETMCELVAERMRLSPDDILVASTGVIGVPLPIRPIKDAMTSLTAALSSTGSGDAAQAIMTTDTLEKEIAVSFDVGGTPCKLGAIAKGSGMIHPNMGTMLAFLTTDCAISANMIEEALRLVVDDTFNMVSIDGDTSTNDMAVLLSSGMAHNPPIEEQGEAFDAFLRALMYVCIYLARLMAKDGEGATKLLECTVTGAPDDETARTLAKSVISSSLVKAAMFGSDANWGRILCAMGYSGADFDMDKIEVKFSSEQGDLLVFWNGAGVIFDEDRAKQILSCDEIEICIDLAQGDSVAAAWGCDLTYDYVKINGDYRS